jgi:hypothetical protein
MVIMGSLVLFITLTAVIGGKEAVLFSIDILAYSQGSLRPLHDLFRDNRLKAREDFVQINLW